MKNTMIPSTAFLYKTGLYINEFEETMDDFTWTVWELFADTNYCFYDLQIPENYDEEGNLLPPEQRIYYTYSIMAKDEEYVTNYIIPVLYEAGFEIANEPTNTPEII